MCSPESSRARRSQHVSTPSHAPDAESLPSASPHESHAASEQRLLGLDLSGRALELRQPRGRLRRLLLEALLLEAALAPVERAADPGAHVDVLEGLVS